MRQRPSHSPPVILRSAATKNPVNRRPCVATRDPSLALRMTAFFCCDTWAVEDASPYMLTACHSEERSDEESREQDAVRSHTGSFAGAQDDREFAFVGPFPGTKNKEMYIPFGICISLFVLFSGGLSYRLAFFFLPAETVTVTAAADRENRAAHRAKLLLSPVFTVPSFGISAFSV